MKFIVPNLHRRPDKKKAMMREFPKAGIDPNDVMWVNSHDAEGYANMECLIDAMICDGWDMDREICGSIPEKMLGKRDWAGIRIRPMPHMAFRWTYLSILRHIVENNVEATVLIDDMCFATPKNGHNTLKQCITELKQKGGGIMGLDPTRFPQESASLVTAGYRSPTEESVYYTPDGASAVIPLIVDDPWRVIGDVYRIYEHGVLGGKIFSTNIKIMTCIGKKSDWSSDIHVNSDSQFF